MNNVRSGVWRGRATLGRLNSGIRDLLGQLEARDQLYRIPAPVSLRHISALVAESDKALVFDHVSGYSMPLVSGLTNDRERLAIAAGVPYAEIERLLRRAFDQPIEPVVVDHAVCQEVVVCGDDVDLTALPAPVFSEQDGGPYITAGVVLANDPAYGLNAGVYRFMLRDRCTLGIDIVTPNNLNTFCQRAFREGRPVPISVSIGTHPLEIIASTYKAALGVNEMAVSGGMRGEAVELTRCRTVDALAIGNAEIVLEGEIQPEGWVYPEGRFGEFSRLLGGLHMNPIVKVRAMTHRRDPLYYALHMPWENIWLSAPIYEAAARRVLREADVEVTAINVTPGGCCHWHIVAAIRAKPGDGKNAIAALLSIADIKHVVVTDSDIDVFDPTEVEWAVATRVQADRDVVILSHARAKPLDPSIPPGVKTTAKMGIDATIGEGIPRERYDRITHPYLGEVHLADVLAGRYQDPAPPTPMDNGHLMRDLEEFLRQGYAYYNDVLRHFADRPDRVVISAIAQLSADGRLERDSEGRYRLASRS
jgi:2,5-furandicarboxylate decarboxylase 1